LIVTGAYREEYNSATRLDRMIISNIDSGGQHVFVGKMWFIDKTGKKAIDLQILKVNEALLTGFSDGLAAIKIEDKWGYIDKTGKLAIEPQFEAVWPFSQGLAKVKLGDKHGYIDKTGKYVWKPTN